MKIMSFNTQHCLNYLEQTIDFKVMADAIKKCDADIVGLNEMRDKGENPDYEEQTKFLAELTGLSYYYFAKAFDVDGVNPYGNGILSKFPIKSVQTVYIPIPAPKKPETYYEQRCMLKAKLDNGLTVLVSHFGLNPDEHICAVNTVLEHLENEKCILMGDFNMTPDNPILDPIRERMKDTAELFSTPLLSHPSDNPNVKIDYIFVSRDIEIVAADIPAIVASDHRPHTAELNM